MLRLIDHNITNFTPTPAVARVLQAMKFTEIVGDQIALFAVPAPSRKPVGWNLSIDPSEFASRLSPQDREILASHSRFECHHALLGRMERTATSC